MDKDKQLTPRKRKKYNQVEFHEKSYPLYKKGLYDHQIAEKIGCSISTVTKWRTRKGLVSNRAKEIDEIRLEKFNRFIAMEKDGASDREVCSELGVNLSQVAAWREKGNLPPGKVSLIEHHKASKFYDKIPEYEKKVIRDFMSQLITTYQDAKRNGLEGDFDVSSFISVYREIDWESVWCIY